MFGPELATLYMFKLPLAWLTNTSHWILFAYHVFILQVSPDARGDDQTSADLEIQQTLGSLAIGHTSAISTPQSRGVYFILPHPPPQIINQSYQYTLLATRISSLLCMCLCRFSTLLAALNQRSKLASRPFIQSKCPSS